MDFWEQTIESTKKFISVAEKKTDEFIIVQKLGYKISNLQSKLKNKYAEMGKLLSEQMQNNQEIDVESFSALQAEIAQFKQEIKALNIELADVKGKQTCPNCGAKCDAKSAYCNKCGAQL